MAASTAAKKKPAVHPRAQRASTAVVDLNQKSIEIALKAVEKNRSLLAIYEQLRRVVGKARHDEALGRYDIGRLVGQVRAEKDKYRQGSVEKLATLLQFDASTLYDYADVADTWKNKTEFKLLLRNGCGCLTFSHCVVLSQVADPKYRAALVQRIRDKRLTVRQLAETIRTTAAADDVAAEATAAPADVVRRITAHWEGVVDAIERDMRTLELLVTQIPDARVLLAATAKQQRALAEKAGAYADKLDALAKAGPTR